MYSFQTYTLADGATRLTVAPHLGCRWMSLQRQVNGAWLDILWPSPDIVRQFLEPFSYGSYLMAPWCNRVASGVFRFGGERFTLAKNFPDGSAIHGDVYHRPWKLERVDAASFEAKLDSRLHANFNFPFALLFRHSIRLSNDAVRTTLSVENVGPLPAPAGFGFHPFFRKHLAPGSARPVELTLPAKSYYPARATSPARPPKPVTRANDLRRPTPVVRPIDACYTALTAAPITLRYAEPRLTIDLTFDKIFNHVFVYAPKTHASLVAAATEPADFVCVEPMTQAVDGFNALARGWKNSGTKTLQPGELLSGGFEMKFR